MPILGLVFLSDEDDCSAATNDGMFGDKPELRGESASLRCATRAHACGGNNLTTSPPGYPTTAAFTHAFSDCQARTDSCPNATDGNVHWHRYLGADRVQPAQRHVHHLASELKALKADPTTRSWWPASSAGHAATRTWPALSTRSPPCPTPTPRTRQHPTVYDYWPVCYDPNHLPSPATTDPATGFDATAAAWGATGGLRESAFVDEFGKPTG
jgi:hypothetical protein